MKSSDSEPFSLQEKGRESALKGYEGKRQGISSIRSPLKTENFDVQENDNAALED